MELTYTCEEREKEGLALAMRPYSRYIRSWFVCAGVFGLLAIAECAVHLLNCMINGGGSVSGDVRCEFFAALLLTSVGIILRWQLRCSILELLRGRTTNLVEYRLTDDVFAYSCGETKMSLPLGMFKKYRIDEDAFYLLTSTGAVCVPCWKGHGMEKEDIATVLEKAGLKNVRTGKVWRMVRCAVMATLYCLVVFYVYVKMHNAWDNLRREIGYVELMRQLHELTGIGTRWECYPDFRQWKRSGNLAQRFVASAGPVEFDIYGYMLDEEAEEDKVGLAAIKDDTVWCVYLPCGCMETCDKRDWESRKWRQGVFYKPSERERWQEKARRLAPKLLKARD